MARRDMPDVVMRFDGLRKSGGSTFLTGCGPQVSLGSRADMLALFAPGSFTHALRVAHSSQTR